MSDYRLGYTGEKIDELLDVVDAGVQTPLTAGVDYVEPWKSPKTYAAGAYCEHNGYLWHNTSGAESTGVEPGTDYNVWNVTYSNVNLLDNWCFASPVNQRGVGTQEKPWTSGYGIDRWYIHNPQSGAEVRVETTGITIDNSGGAATLNVVHKMERQLSVGDTITLSVLLQDGSIKSNKGVITESGTVAQVNIPSAAALYYAKSGNWVVAGVYAGQSVSIRAVKLELGSVSTLANDAPPNYETELAKCQKYYNRLLLNGSLNALVPFCVNDAGSLISLMFPLQVRNSAATIKIVGTLYLKGSTGGLGTVTFSGTEHWTTYQNKPFFICTTNKALTGGIGGVALADRFEFSVSADL